MSRGSPPVAGRMVLTGRLICRSAAEADTVRQALPEHTRLTRAEPGCVSFEVVETADPLVWTVQECFRDREAFDAHQSRTRASAWWVATSTIRRDYRLSGPECPPSA